MRSSNRQYLAAVDHVRAFAAILIVFYHCTGLLLPRFTNAGVVDQHIHTTNPFGTLIFEGHTAVALFMVLSGFIFTVGTLGHGVSFTRFMANRLLRIYPLFVLLILVGLAAFSGSLNIGSLFMTLIGLGNYPGALNLGAVSAMFWAVAVEMQFYLLFPLLNRILTRSGLSTFTKMLAAVIVVRFIVWTYSGPRHDAQSFLYFNLAGRIDEFLIGMIAAWFFVRKRHWFQGWWKFAAAAGLALTALWLANQYDLLAANGRSRLVWVDGEAAMWALVILTYAATLRSSNLVSRFAARIGEISYSIYLLHFVLVQITMKEHWIIDPPGSTPLEQAFLTATFIVLPLLLLASFVTYHGVERPFLNLRMRYLVDPTDAPVPELVVPGPASPERSPVSVSAAQR